MKINKCCRNSGTFLGVLGVMGVLCFMLLPMAKLASSRVSGSTDTSLESNGGSFLDTAMAYRTDFNINLFNVKFIFRVSGSTDTSLESKGGSFLDTAIAYRINFNINLYSVILIYHWLAISFKGQCCHEIFCFGFLEWIIFPQAQGSFRIFPKIRGDICMSRCITGVNGGK